MDMPGGIYEEYCMETIIASFPLLVAIMQFVYLHPNQYARTYIH